MGSPLNSNGYGSSVELRNSPQNAKQNENYINIYANLFTKIHPHGETVDVENAALINLFLECGFVFSCSLSKLALTLYR